MWTVEGCIISATSYKSPWRNFQWNLHKHYIAKYFHESEFIIVDAYSGCCKPLHWCSLSESNSFNASGLKDNHYTACTFFQFFPQRHIAKKFSVKWKLMFIFQSRQCHVKKKIVSLITYLFISTISWTQKFCLQPELWSHEITECQIMDENVLVLNAKLESVKQQIKIKYALLWMAKKFTLSILSVVFLTDRKSKIKKS